VTGSTSLITVPVILALGIEAHVAVATNMRALTFMSVGGWLPFISRGVLSRRRLPVSVALTIIGSGLGALLLFSVPFKAQNFLTFRGTLKSPLRAIIRLQCDSEFADALPFVHH
jgi:uncharacterized membrane protein YfcA